MDQNETPKRPWWRKRRWRLAVALWLCLPLYVAAAGPVMYAETAGLVPADTYVVTFRPLYRTIFALQDGGGRADRALNRYALWWADLTPRFRPVRMAEPYP